MYSVSNNRNQLRSTMYACSITDVLQSTNMTRGALVQICYEFAPVGAFFLAGQLVPFAQAVLILVISTVLSIIVAWLYHRTVPVIPLLSGVLVVITGVLTIYFNKPDAIILADTIWFWGLAAAIAVGFYQKAHLLERMFSKTFALTQTGWRKLSIRWMIVLLLAGLANEYVRLMMTPEFWIDYRFTKIMVIMLFSLYQFRLARRYRIEGESNPWGLRIRPVN